MSPKMKEALADITMAGNEGACRRNWHGATVAALLRSGAIETVPGDDTMVRVPKASTKSAGVTAGEITRDPADEEFPNATCAHCTRPILWVHDMWITTVGADRCDASVMGHVPADLEQDALEAEQQRTGIHAACGLPLADHCADCDVCPTPAEMCGCGDEGTIGYAEEGTLIAGVVYGTDGYEVDDDEPTHLVPAPVVTDWQDARRWEAQRIRYAMRVANRHGEIGTDAHRCAYTATLERGYPRRKPSKHRRNR